MFEKLFSIFLAALFVLTIFTYNVEAEEDEEVGVDVGDRVGVELEEGEEAFGEILEFVEEDGDEFVVVLLDDGDEVEVEFDMIFPEE